MHCSLPSQDHPGGRHGDEAPVPRHPLMACGLAIGDVDVVALTRVHFANVTRLRRRRGWWPARDSGAVCLTIKAKGTDELSMQRHTATASKQVETQNVQRVSERLGASDRDGNFPAFALQTKDRTFDLAQPNGRRAVPESSGAVRFVGGYRKASGRGRQVTGLCCAPGNGAMVRFS